MPGIEMREGAEIGRIRGIFQGGQYRAGTADQNLCGFYPAYVKAAKTTGLPPKQMLARPAGCLLTHRGTNCHFLHSRARGRTAIAADKLDGVVDHEREDLFKNE